MGDAGLRLPCDGLVKNAGLWLVGADEGFSAGRFSLMLRGMLGGPFRLSRRVLPRMCACGWGRVVSISSGHGMRGSMFKAAGMAVYLCTSHAGSVAGASVGDGGWIGR
jgi:NAD(P)-dependent dehydrogenase (short-subunit alcohol dehydrogenase family)